MMCWGVVHVIKAFGPSTLALALASLETINVLHALHPLDLSFPFKTFWGFWLNSNLEFSLDSFRLAFIESTHFLIGGPSSMIFKMYIGLLTPTIQPMASHSSSK